MTALGFTGRVVETGGGGGVFSVEWRIPNFLSLGGESDDFYSSPSFHFCGGEWFLCVYPNGIPHFTPSGWVSLFLYNVDAGPPETLSVALGIRGAGGLEKKRERWEEFSEDDRVCCWFEICSRSELERQKSRLMPGNELIIALDIKGNVAGESSAQEVEECKEAEVAIEEDLQISENQGVEELQKSLHGLLAGGEDSDVTIMVQGEEFPAHRAILRARSPVLQAMFTHDVVESQSGVVTMEDCDPESFPAFLEHVYTGSTGMISIGSVFSLFTSADKYNLDVLKEACMTFIKNNLTVSCFCDAIALAVRHGEEELTACTTEFFISNALDIMLTNEWESFLKENTTVGNELIIKAFSR